MFTPLFRYDIHVYHKGQDMIEICLYCGTTDNCWFISNASYPCRESDNPIKEEVIIMPKHSNLKKMIKTVKASKPKKPVRGSRTAKNNQRVSYGKKKK